MKIRDPIWLEAFLAWTVKTRGSHDLNGFVMLIHLSLEIKVNMKLGFGKKEKWKDFLFVSIRQFVLDHCITHSPYSGQYPFLLSTEESGVKNPRKKKVSVLRFPLFTHLIPNISSFFPIVTLKPPPASFLWTWKEVYKESPIICIHAHPRYFPCKALFSGLYNVTLS